MKNSLTTPYIAFTAVLGLAALAYGAVTTDLSKIDPVMLGVLAVLAAVSQRLPVFLFRSSAISVAFTATIATYVLYGTGPALLVTLVSAAVNAFTPTRKSADKAIFNTGALTLSAFAAAQTYALFNVTQGDMVMTVLGVAISASVYFIINSALTAQVIAFTTAQKFSTVWKSNYSWMVVNYLATAVNGASLALAYQSLNVFGSLTFVLPLGVAWYSFKLYMNKSSEVRLQNDELVKVNEILLRTNERLEESHISVIGALVGALEAKDSHTHGHSAATMFHAVAVAKKLGLSDDDVAAVQLGALFHDIGKIGIPEQILRKPEALTDSEWTEMKSHPTIGANLLAHVPALERVRPIILAHHERYDGTGYPNGLKGHQIPLAAQIISVADTYEAMTSTRPYRRALPKEVAIAELRAVAGTQLSPIVVEAFIEQITDGSHATEHSHEHVYQQAARAVGAR